MATSKPDLTRVFAIDAPGGDVVDPDVTPGSNKFTNGYDAEFLAFQNFNFLHQLVTQGLAHINEQGIAVWDAPTTYELNAIVKGDDGEIYISLVGSNINFDPVSNPTKWSGNKFSGFVWSTQTGDFDAFPGNGYLFDGSAVSTVTLPASPLDGNSIVLADLNDSFTGDNVTVDGDGTDIEGSGTYTLDVNGSRVELVYSGSTSQWEVILSGASQAKVAQVLSTAKTDTFTTASSSFVDVTGLSVTITPSSTASKIWVSCNVSGSNTSTGFWIIGRLVRDSTAISIGDTAGVRPRASFQSESDVGNHVVNHPIMFLDSPATTSAVTYKIQILTPSSGSAVINRVSSDADQTNISRTASSITVMEILA